MSCGGVLSLSRVSSANRSASDGKLRLTGGKSHRMEVALGFLGPCKDRVAACNGGHMFHGILGESSKDRRGHDDVTETTLMAYIIRRPITSPIV